MSYTYISMAIVLEGNTCRTVRKSDSLAGFGHLPGSSVTLLKKLYPQSNKLRTKAKCANAWPSVSMNVATTRHEVRKELEQARLYLLGANLVTQTSPTQKMLPDMMAAK